MSISEADYLAMLRRCWLKKQAKPQTEAVPAGMEIELLHGPIMEWAAAQHPRVPIIHTRPDQASGTTPGAPDFAIVYRGRIILVECKTAKGKLSPDQLAWHMLAELQGVKVETVRSMEEFLRVVDNPPTPKED